MPKMRRRRKTTGCVFDVFHKDKVCDIPKTHEDYVDPMDRLRPDKHRAKRYSLNQTFALMDKGAVKLRYTDTQGDYEWFPPGYKPKEKKRHERGRGPLRWLQEEMWAQVVERQQEETKRLNALKKQEADAFRLKEGRSTERLISKAVGPDWYQELSGQQMAVVDKLHLSILIDRKKNSILCTRENLNDLGVKAKRRIVAFALKHCCYCPSELLLIVYQLINPGRTRYTVTDRLLLSAIVHLTMRETLKELHIRIPSPPPGKRRIRRPRKEEDRGTCASPYLDKYIYDDHRPWKKWGKPEQICPRNEYFSYLKDLKRRTIYIDATEPISEPNFDLTKLPDDCYDCAMIGTELKLVKEWVYAQTIYNKLSKRKVIRALHKASVYPVCHSGLVPDVTVESTLEGSEDVIEEEVEGESFGVDDSENKEEFGICGNYCESDESGEERIEEVEVAAEVADGEVGVVGGGGDQCRKKEPPIQVDDSGVCRCKELILRMIKEKECQCKECAEDRRRRNEVRTTVIADTTRDDFGDPLQIISGVQSKTICTCMEKYLKKWKRHEQWENLKKAQDDLKELKDKFIITGVTTGSDGKPLYILQGVKGKEKCACYDAQKMKEEEELKKALQPKIPEGCTKYIVSGVRSTPEGNVYILSGVTQNLECACMEIYEKFIENHALCLMLYNAYLKKIRIESKKYMEDLSPEYDEFIPVKFEDRKYTPVENNSVGDSNNPNQTESIGNSEENNSVDDKEVENYNADSTIVDNKIGKQSCGKCPSGGDNSAECPCGRAKQPPNDNQTTQCPCDGVVKNNKTPCGLEPSFPQCPCGCSKGKQSGVSEAAQSCPCGGVVDENNETPCGLPSTNFPSCPCGCSRNATSPSNDGVNPVCPCDELSEGALNNACDTRDVPITCKLVGFNYDDVPKTAAGEVCRLTAAQEVEAVPEVELLSESFDSGSLYCTCDEDNSKRELERYIILEEFPKNETDQYELLKTALAKLAEDGFPLAVLPEAYRLPHFRIWLRLRAKQCWTRKMKSRVVTQSKLLAAKFERCKDKARLPDCKFLKDEPEKQNWSYRYFVKKKNEEIMNNFYDRAKEVELNYARMFYPITFNYEFPSKALRDVFYTYMPSKEAEILMYKIWQGYEYRRAIKRNCG